MTKKHDEEIPLTNEELLKQNEEQKELIEKLQMDNENLTVEIKILKDEKEQVQTETKEKGEKVDSPISERVNSLIEEINEADKEENDGINQMILHGLVIARDYAKSKEANPKK